jgi:putative heme-binding domain-containing protein
MNFSFRKLLLTGLGAAIFLPSGVACAREKEKPPPPPPPIRALLVTGGASHDYQTRKEILVQGIRERVGRPIEWVVRYQGEGESDVRIPLFEEVGWAEGYDIVVHDYCFPQVKDVDYVDRILAPHRAGLPAVLVHGTMQSFRTGDDRWFDFCGATSRGHGKPLDFSIEPAPGGNPIVTGMAKWTIPRGELYLIERLHPGSTALTFSLGEGEAKEKEPTSWSHLYGPAKARVFATTLGNESSTLMTPAYLDMLAKGFLWALDPDLGGLFIKVETGKSLSGFSPAPPGSMIPNPGPNLASRGRASALTSGKAGLFGADKAIDGNPETYWEAENAGPASWQVDLGTSRDVGAFLLVWKEGAPDWCQVEYSSDSLNWRTLFDGAGGGSEPLTVGFDPLKMRHLRVTIPGTKPGVIPGIREFAVYRAMDEMPAAFPDFRLINGSPRVDLSGAAVPGAGGKMRIAAEWSIGPITRLPEGKSLVRLIPAASGKVYVLCSEVGSGDRSVHLVSPDEEGILHVSELLGGLAPGAEVAWDGEWIYLLQGADLNAYRDSDGDGHLDDRSRLGAIFSPARNAPVASLQFSQFQAGPDGWFYAMVDSTEEINGFNAGNDLVQMPRHGVVRFRRDGSDLNVIATSPTALEDIQFGREGSIFARRAVKNRFADGSGLYLLTPLPGRAWHDLPDLSWPPSPDHDPQWSKLDLFVDRDRVHAAAGGKRIGIVAEIGGLTSVAGDGERIWVSGMEKGRGFLTVLAPSATPATPPVNWDLLAPRDVFPHLASPNRGVRIEAVYEVLRRKYRPNADLEKWLLTDLTSPAIEGILATLSASGSRRDLEVIIRTAKSPDPLRQALAFRHLGDHAAMRNHEVFGEITRTTVPSVSAAILSAMERSGTSIPGLDDLVFSFAGHPDPNLAATARTFLQTRGASAVCFEHLKDERKSTTWPTAFAVLSGIRRTSVVEQLVLFLETTGSARIRGQGLETLVALYFDDTAGHRPWKGTAIADVFLRASLLDHRVDRGSLLRQMKASGLPVPGPDLLLELGASSIPLEAYAIDALDSGKDPLPGSAGLWLDSIFRSPDRDVALRSKALGLLVRDGGGMDYGKSFEAISRFIDPVQTSEFGRHLILQWLSRTDHPVKTEWLIDQSGNTSANKALLAWITLVEVLKRDGVLPETAALITKQADAVLGGPEAGIASILRATPWAGDTLAEKVLRRAADAGLESLRIEARELVRARAFSPDRDGRQMTAGGTEMTPLLSTLASLQGDPVAGRQLFRTLSCGACHNTHGEGPALGPDLATFVQQRPKPELIEAILSPAARVSSGYEATLFELTGGRPLIAFEEGRNADTIDLRDRAGNVLNLPLDRVRMASPLNEGARVCEADGDLPVRDFAALLAYLVSLGK